MKEPIITAAAAARPPSGRPAPRRPQPRLLRGPRSWAAHRPPWPRWPQAQAAHSRPPSAHACGKGSSVALSLRLSLAAPGSWSPSTASARTNARKHAQPPPRVLLERTFFSRAISASLELMWSFTSRPPAAASQSAIRGGVSERVGGRIHEERERAQAPHVPAAGAHHDHDAATMRTSLLPPIAPSVPCSSWDLSAVSSYLLAGREGVGQRAAGGWSTQHRHGICPRGAGLLARNTVAGEGLPLCPSPTALAGARSARGPSPSGYPPWC